MTKQTNKKSLPLHVPIFSCINNAINGFLKSLTTSVCTCFSFTPLYLSALILKARQAIPFLWLLPLCCCLIRNEQLAGGKVKACTYLPRNKVEAKRSNFSLHSLGNKLRVTNRNCFGINKQHTVRYESLKKKKHDFHMVLSGNSRRIELSVKNAEVRVFWSQSKKIYHSRFGAWLLRNNKTNESQTLT